jgi:hypothetical protein
MVEIAMPKKDAALDLTVAAWVAMFAILVGWFFLDTLVVTVGPVQHGVRFFELSAAIANPPRILFGLDNDHMFNSILFGLFCCAAALAPLLARNLAPQLSAAAYFAPLALILICATALYLRTSGDLLAAPESSNTLGSDLVRLANDLLNRGAGVAAKSVTVGAGGYLAALGSVWLAVQGGRRWWS